MRERAALVGLFTDSHQQLDPEHSLDELSALAAAAGAEVVLRIMQERGRPDAATFLGSGKVAQLAAAADELNATLVIFNNELSPAQLRNLERALDRKVIDRTQLILDIFARRARTREGKLQVELAQLRYLMPRLVGSSALSRLGGGIGTRGPGETKLETDRRRIRYRISQLGKEIDTVKRRREQLRERRHIVHVARSIVHVRDHRHGGVVADRVGQLGGIVDEPQRITPIELLDQALRDVEIGRKVGAF